MTIENVSQIPSVAKTEVLDLAQESVGEWKLSITLKIKASNHNGKQS